jgi:hypothetical protein
VEDFVRRADLLDLTLVHHQHAVGQFQGFVLVVGDEDARQMNLVVQAAEPLPQLLPHLGVERAERLIQQQHFRLDGQRPGQRHALPLSAGELVRIAMGHALQLHQFQKPHDLVFDQVSGGAMFARPHPQPERHVLEHGHVTE